MRRHILVVDDDHELRSLIQTLLEEEAYEVETAIDGVDAIEHLDHHWNAYDVMVLDLTMPRLGGLQCVQKIQEHDPTLLRSIIALSADEEALRQSAAMGIGSTLSKPFDLDVLLVLVGGVIGGSEKEVFALAGHGEKEGLPQSQYGRKTASFSGMGYVKGKGTIV